MSTIKPIVKVGMTIHKIAKFQPTDTTVKVNLEIYFTYPEDQILSIFEKYTDDIDFRKTFKIPFLISNSIGTNIESEVFSKIKVDPDKNINYHNNKNSETPNSIIYRLEKYMITCELEVVNFTNLLPFNKVIIPINIITNGSPGTEEIYLIEEFKIFKKSKIMINQLIELKYITNNDDAIYIFRFINDKLNKEYGYYKVKIDDDFILTNNKFKINSIDDDNLTITLNTNQKIKIINKWSANYDNISTYQKQELSNYKFFKKSDIVWGKFISQDTEDRVFQDYNKMSNLFYNKWNWYDIVHAIEKKHNVIEDHQGGYSRIYFTLSHSFSITEDIIKYYLIPTILTITLMLFYTIDTSSFSGLFPTIMLGNIALLFIQPETGKFTYNERSVHLNIALTIILSIFKVIGVSIYFSQLWWVIIILFINLINLINNIIVSNHTMNKIDNVFKEADISTIEELFNGNDSKLNCNCFCCFSTNIDSSNSNIDIVSEYGNSIEYA